MFNFLKNVWDVANTSLVSSIISGVVVPFLIYFIVNILKKREVVKTLKNYEDDPEKYKQQKERIQKRYENGSDLLTLLTKSTILMELENETEEVEFENLNKDGDKDIDARKKTFLYLLECCSKRRTTCFKEIAENIGLKWEGRRYLYYIAGLLNSIKEEIKKENEKNVFPYLNCIVVVKYLRDKKGILRTNGVVDCVNFKTDEENKEYIENIFEIINDVKKIEYIKKRVIDILKGMVDNNSRERVLLDKLDCFKVKNIKELLNKLKKIIT